MVNAFGLYFGLTSAFGAALVAFVFFTVVFLTEDLDMTFFDLFFADALLAGVAFFATTFFTVDFFAPVFAEDFFGPLFFCEDTFLAI